MQALFWRLETSGVMTVHPSTIILRADVSNMLNRTASVGDQFEAVEKQHPLASRLSISMRRLDSSGQTQQDRCFVLPLLRISSGRPIYGGEDELLVLVHK
jgi:hypothetical protein